MILLMSNMKYLIILALAILIVSCQGEDNNNNISYTMKDGTVLTVQEETHIYESADSFLNSDNNLRKTPDDIVINQETTKDSIYGYDQILPITWEKAKFGQWIEKYNLNRNKTYFVQTIRVVKLIHSPDEYAITEGAYNDYNKDSIGVNINTGKRGFVISSSNLDGSYEAYTIMKIIGYDNDGNFIGFYYPLDPSNLKWKYFKIKTIW